MFHGDSNKNKHIANPNIFPSYAPSEHNGPPIVPAPAGMCPEEETHQDLPAGLAFKHPLHNTWTMWYLEKYRTQTWEEMQSEIATFNTVEDFWSIYYHIKPPSDFQKRSNYSLFKRGIKPMWTGSANKQGGRWMITLDKNLKAELDDLWLDSMLCLIGEILLHTEEICGAVVNMRRNQNTISIWTANGGNEKAILDIGRKLRENLHLGRITLQYKLYTESSNGITTYTKYSI